MVAMAAGPGGWLGPAFGLRLLLAAVLQAVSEDHLRGILGASGGYCSEEDETFSTEWEPHLERVGGLGFLSHRCGRNATWLHS